MVWHDSAMEITGDEFHEVVNNSNDIVVVNFFAEWCMPCLMLAPVIEELAEKIDKVKFTKINVDDNTELAKNFRVSNIPCIVVFKKGEEIHRMVGAQTADVIEEKILKILEGL